MKKCVVLVTDKNYFEHTKALFVALKTAGKWDGDYCMVTNNFSPSKAIECLSIIEKGIDCFPITEKNPYMSKFNLFNTFFKKWDKIVFIDADFLILGDMKKLITDDKFLVDFEGTKIGQFFDEQVCPNVYDELKEQYNLDQWGFNSGCMVYDTDIITDTTIDELNELRKKWAPINKHTSLEEGTDQPIINLKFIDICKQIDGVSFHRKRRGGEVAIHTCRWEAPWKDARYTGIYNHNLSQWNNIHNFKE